MQTPRLELNSTRRKEIAMYVFVCPHCGDWMVKDDEDAMADVGIIKLHQQQRIIEKKQPCKFTIPVVLHPRYWNMIDPCVNWLHWRIFLGEI